MEKKPLIKYNAGNPIALCNRCFCIMCSVSCPDETMENCVVLERKSMGDVEVITTPVGNDVPIYCKRCEKLLKHYFLN